MLRLRAATIGYGSRPVVHDADLDVRPGQCLALLGANGAGKTTLIRGLLGLADVLSGEVEVAGRRLSGRATPVHAIRGRVGYVPQRLAPTSGIPTTATEVVGAGLLAGGRAWWVGSGGRSRVLAALDEVGMLSAARTPVSHLSGGQQRRVLIARALVGNPDLLLLDEPTAGVDRASVLSLVATLARLRAAGRTLVVVTHDLTALHDVVDRVVTLVDGRLVEGRTDRIAGGH